MQSVHQLRPPRYEESEAGLCCELQASDGRRALLFWPAFDPPFERCLIHRLATNQLPVLDWASLDGLEEEFDRYSPRWHPHQAGAGFLRSLTRQAMSGESWRDLWHVFAEHLEQFLFLCVQPSNQLSTQWDTTAPACYYTMQLPDLLLLLLRGSASGATEHHAACVAAGMESTGTLTEGGVWSRFMLPRLCERQGLPPPASHVISHDGYGGFYSFFADVDWQVD